MTERKLRVLVVDDTVVYRRILGDAVAALPDAEVVGTACHGRLALERLEQAPADLVLLDVEMPEMDGPEALREIRHRHPETSVVMISGAGPDSAATTMRCLEQGALDFLRKPETTDPEANRSELRERLRPLLRHVRDRLDLRGAGTESAAGQSEPVRFSRPAPVRLPPPERIDLVAVGISTGGPNALGELIPRLPAGFPVPVLVVQHMPPVFTASLAEHLDQRSPLSVTEARDGEPIMPGRVYFAPGGRHMVVRRRPEGAPGPALAVGLNDQPPEHGCRPSVDVLFRSLAAHCEGNLLALVMTGMGSDGCEGVRAMKRRGCRCLTQSRASCVIYGMPQSVDEAGLADEQVPLERMAERVVHWVCRHREP
jgi:two-component system chemotaxis response regulator CheB